MSLSKSLLVEQLAAKSKHMALKDIELGVKIVLESMIETMAQGKRVEVRGFGSFSLHYHKPRIGRNPKTGDPVSLKGKYVPHFKPGKEMRERVNASMSEFPLIGD